MAGEVSSKPVRIRDARLWDVDEECQRFHISQGNAHWDGEARLLVLTETGSAVVLH